MARWARLPQCDKIYPTDATPYKIRMWLRSSIMSRLSATNRSLRDVAKVSTCPDLKTPQQVEVLTIPAIVNSNVSDRGIGFNPNRKPVAHRALSGTDGPQVFIDGI